MFLVLHFDPFSTDGKVCTRNKFFAVRHPSSATAQGLFDFFDFKRAVEYMKLDKWETKTVGNLEQGGLRGLLTCEMP